MTDSGHSSEFNLVEYIMHHVQDSNVWQLPFLPPIHLPPPLTMHGLMLILCSAFLIFLFCFVYKKDQKIPSGLTNCLEAMILFIRDETVIPYLGEEDGRKMTPLFCTFFFFILGLNLMGLIPLFATATSNISVTAALAIITLSFMIFGAIYKNGIIGFFKGLMPAGVPVPILVIMFPIELVGLFAKAFALTIRLFANLLAGHIVIFAILGLVIIIGLVALPAVLLAVMIYMIEIFISFLQAYIFTLLSALFIGQTLHPDH